MKHDSLIQIDEVCSHWKNLMFYDNCVIKDDKSNMSILTEWEVIQERLFKACYNMKLHIKEKIRMIAYLKNIDLKPPSQSVKTKSAYNKVKPTPSDNSKMWSPLYFEHVDNIFSDSPNSKSQNKCSERISN